MAARFLGIAHPPGFPLYVLLAHLASLFPIGNVAARVNFASAFFAALACGMPHARRGRADRDNFVRYRASTKVHRKAVRRGRSCLLNRSTLMTAMPVPSNDCAGNWRRIVLAFSQELFGPTRRSLRFTPSTPFSFLAILFLMLPLASADRGR